MTTPNTKLDELVEWILKAPTYTKAEMANKINDYFYQEFIELGIKFLTDLGEDDKIEAWKKYVSSGGL